MSAYPAWEGRKALAGFAASSRKPEYRRRNPLPAAIIIMVLVVAAIIVWVSVLNEPDRATVIACPPTPTGAPAGQVLPWKGLDQVAPVPAEQARVRVLNANGSRGQAGVVTSQLLELGFQVGEAANDPLYPNYGLACSGQIRFGEAGAAAARTLSIIVPCAELVRDVRPDTTVDLALGTNFDELSPGPEARDVLAQLSQPAPPGGPGGPAAPPPVDPGLIQTARKAEC